MSNILEYKGYHAKVEYSVEDEVLFGTVLGINDLITFEADSAEDIKKNFHEAMDDYLSMCDWFNKEPQKEYTGNFNVRISPELHKKLVFKAMEENMSLNKMVEKILQEGIEKNKGSVLVLPMFLETQENTQNYQYSYNDKEHVNNQSIYREKIQWQN